MGYASDGEFGRLNGRGLSFPPTRAYYVHRLHQAVKDLICQAEKLSLAGARFVASVASEIRLWCAVDEVEALLPLTSEIPPDSIPRLDSSEAEAWLERLFSDLPSRSDRLAPSPESTGHARRLASPEYLAAFRSILKLIPDPFDGPKHDQLMLFEWCRYHYGTASEGFNFDAPVSSAFWTAWRECALSDAGRGETHRGLCSLDETVAKRRELLIASGLIRTDRIPVALPAPDGPNRPAAPESLDSRAVGFAHEMIASGKGINVADVARRLGCERTKLYDLPGFTALVKQDRAGREAAKRRRSRGTKDRQTGSVEAWRDDE